MITDLLLLAAAALLWDEMEPGSWGRKVWAVLTVINLVFLPIDMVRMELW